MISDSWEMGLKVEFWEWVEKFQRGDGVGPCTVVSFLVQPRAF